MGKTSESKEPLADEGTGPDRQGSNSVLNSPEIDEKTGKPKQRAITNAKQAHAIAKKLFDRAKTGRINTATTIAGKYNGEPPFDPAKLSAAAQSWRNNFSTNFLASIIDRVKPQMLDPINKSDVLTHSALPAKIDNAAAKSRLFCEVTTRTIRNWPQWRDFASQLAQENVLYGIAVPAWLDNPTEWRPRLWRYDEAALPEGTGQHATVVQMACFSQKMLIHEFIELFQDKAAAEKLCYNIENCIKAANATTNQGRRADENNLEVEDRKREQGGSLVDSYDDVAKTVNLYHVIVRDYTGGIDLWTVTQDNGMEIRCVEDLHEESIDALTLFTFQTGNGKLYGSKGLGRLLTNLHIAIERGRCLGADQMYLAGLVIFRTSKKDAATLQARVRHPFIFVDDGVEVVTEQIQFDTQAFEMMDAKLTQLAESIAGAFIPPNLNQEGANTKIEAAQNAEREMAVKEGVLGRFFDHLSDLIGAMQRKMYCAINLREGKRAYDKKVERQSSGVIVLARRVWKLLKDAFGAKNKTEPDVSENCVADEESVTAIVELLESGLKIEEIAMLALTPSSQSNATDGAARDQATMQFIELNKGNPFIDQKKATQMSATIALGEDRGKQLVIPTDDPQVEAIAIRQQLIECGQMNTGEAMPVALSDKHGTHRKVLASKFDGIMAALQTAPTEGIVKIAELFFSHYGDHINSDAMMSPDQKTSELKALAQDWAKVQKVKALLEQQKAAMGGQSPDGMPVPVAGQPPQVDPATGRVVGEQSTSIHPADADLKLKIHELGQEDQRIELAKQQHGLEAAKIAHAQGMDKAKLALQANQQQHSQSKDALQLQQANLGMVQDAAKHQLDAGESEADRQVQAAIEAERLKVQQEAAAASTGE